MINSQNPTATEWLAGFLMGDMPFAQRIKLYKKVKKFRERVARNGNDDGRFSNVIEALDVIGALSSPSIELDYRPLVLSGRLANGAERDLGNISHAIPTNGVTSLCGATYGRLSAGWVSPHDGDVVSCQKCLKRIEILRELE